MEFLKAARWFFVSTAVFIAGAVAASFAKHPFEKIGDMATWVGAIGTVGTLIGTIWLATSESRRRTRIGLDRARLTASGMAHRLRSTFDSLQTIRNALIDDANRGFFIVFQDYARLLEESGTWTIDEILPLIQLPNHAAAGLAAAMDLVAECIRLLKQPIGEFETDAIRIVRQRRRTKVTAMLTKAVDLLQKSINECDKFRHATDH